MNIKNALLKPKSWVGPDPPDVDDMDSVDMDLYVFLREAARDERGRKYSPTTGGRKHDQKKG